MDLCRLWRQAGGDARPTDGCKNVGKFIHPIALYPSQGGVAATPIKAHKHPNTEVHYGIRPMEHRCVR
jgi:hypothetical protein